MVNQKNIGALRYWLLFLVPCLVVVAVLNCAKTAWSENQNIADATLKALAADVQKNNIVSIDDFIKFTDDWSAKKGLKTQWLDSTKPSNVVIFGFASTNVNKPTMLPTWKHMIVYQKPGELCFQEVYLGDENESEDEYLSGGLLIPFPDDAIAQKQESVLEIGLVYNSAYGGNALLPVLKIYRWDDQKNIWHPFYSSPYHGNFWNNTDGSIEFPNGDLNTFILKGSGFGSLYAQDNIFVECHACPHRYFKNTWVRVGDEYVVAKWDEVEPTPYSTLTDFIYSISIYDEKAALALVTEPELVEQAYELGLAQDPVGQGWDLDDYDRDCVYSPSKDKYVFRFIKGDVINISKYMLFSMPLPDLPTFEVVVDRQGEGWKISQIKKIK